jgi:HAE1 family hydrophobic/amphiphilic exporter-1
MTLGGLALGVGMMVDNSIVVLENIFRRRDELHERQGGRRHPRRGRGGRGAIVASDPNHAGDLPAADVHARRLRHPLQGAGLRHRLRAPVLALGLAQPRAHAGVQTAWIRPAERRRRTRPAGLIQRLSAGAEGACTASIAPTPPCSPARSATAFSPLTAAALLVASALVLLRASAPSSCRPATRARCRSRARWRWARARSARCKQSDGMERIVTPPCPEAVASVVAIRDNRGRGPASPSAGLERDPQQHRHRRRPPPPPRRPVARHDHPGHPRPQGQFLLERMLGTTEGLAMEVRGFDLETSTCWPRASSPPCRDVPGVTDVDLSRTPACPRSASRVDRAKAADLGLSVRDVAEALETLVAGPGRRVPQPAATPTASSCSSPMPSTSRSTRSST